MRAIALRGMTTAEMGAPGFALLMRFALLRRLAARLVAAAA